MPHQLDAYLLDSDGDPGAGTEVTVDRKGVRTGGTLDAYNDDEGHRGLRPPRTLRTHGSCRWGCAGSRSAPTASAAALTLARSTKAA